MDAIGVSVADAYVAFGVFALFLLAAFIVSMLRFVGADEIPTAGMVGALIAVHPYGVEIFTFRMALPIYGAALLFGIVVLEAIVRFPSRWSARALAFASALAMLFTYQVFANYFAVAVLFGWIFGEISPRDQQSVYRARSILLAAVSLGAIVVFFLVMRVFSLLEVGYTDARVGLITLDRVPQRLLEAVGTLKMVYWQTEPIMPAWLKVLTWLLVGLSIIVTFRYKWRGRQGQNRLPVFIVLTIGMVLLVPLSLGLIILLDVWWPTTRVIAHFAAIMGLVLIIGDYCVDRSKSPLYLHIQGFGRGVMLFGFVLIGNQIFADQSKLNDWDMLTATRLVGRLESSPDFKNIKAVYIGGGCGVTRRDLGLQVNITILTSLHCGSRGPRSSCW